jgi:glycerol-3-phosphate dehydrogenase
LHGEQPVKRSVLEFDRYIANVQRKYAWLPPLLAARYANAYGTRIATLLADRTDIGDMGLEVLPGLYAAEIDYLLQYEWAVTAADIMWRRSKLGLHLPAGSEARLDEWIQAHRTCKQR